MRISYARVAWPVAIALNTRPSPVGVRMDFTESCLLASLKTYALASLCVGRCANAKCGYNMYATLAAPWHAQH
eukprot:6205568-Pleurochrysis_carterae.AAC.1